MDNPPFNDTICTTQWTTSRNSAQSHAVLMARFCSPAFAELIADAAGDVCNASPPASDAEYNKFLTRSQNLIAIIGSVAHASQMSRSCPSATNEILDATRLFLDHVDFDGDVHVESMRLTSDVSGICHRALMQRA